MRKGRIAAISICAIFTMWLFFNALFEYLTHYYIVIPIEHQGYFTILWSDAVLLDLGTGIGALFLTIVAWKAKPTVEMQHG
jgi:hypothetical protein